MARTFGQNFQDVQDAALPVVGTAARTSNEDILTAIDSHLDSPLRIFATQPTADAVLNIGSNQITVGDGSTKSTSPLDDSIATYPGATINMQTGAVGGTGTVRTAGAAFALPTATAAGRFFRMILVYQSADNQIDTLFSSESATEGGLPDAGTLFASLDGTPVGYLDLESTSTSAYKTAGSATNIVENAKLVRFGSGAGGGSGGDTSFRIQSISSNVVKVKKGLLEVSGCNLITNDGANNNVDVSFDLKTGVNATGVTTPAALTTYILAIDLASVGAEVQYGDAGLKVVPVQSGTSGAFVVLEGASAKDINRTRYVPLGVIKTDGASDYTEFENFALRDHLASGTSSVSDRVEQVLDSRSVGNIGQISNSKGELVDADFPSTTGLHYYHLDSDGADDGPNTAVNFDLEGTPTFTGRGLHGRESILSLNGVTDGLSKSDSAFDANQTFTAGGWFRLADWTSSSFQHLFGNIPDGGPNRQYQVHVAGSLLRLFCSSNGSTSTETASVDQNFTPNSFHQIVISHDGAGTWSVYVDGQLATTGTQTITTPGNIELSLGVAEQNGGIQGFMGGQIEDFFFIPTVLTPAQINALYSKRYNGQRLAGGHVLDSDSFRFSSLSGKVAFFNLDADDGAAILDDSGGGNNLTKFGSFTFNDPGINGVDGAMTSSAVSALHSDSEFFRATNSSFLAAAWFQTAEWGDGTNFKQFFSIWNSGANDRTYDTYIDTNNTFVLNRSTDGSAVNNVAVRRDVSDFDLAPGSWHHIALGWDISEQFIKFYLDGELILEQAGPLNQPSGATNFALAAISEAGGQPWLGRIDEFAFIRGAWDGDDIRKLMSYRLDLTGPAASVLKKDRIWKADRKTQDGLIFNRLNENQFILDEKQSKLYLDFGRQSDDEIDLFAHDASNGNSVSSSVVTKSVQYSSAMSATEVFAHGLSGVPSFFSISHKSNGTDWEPIDFVGKVKADATNVTLSGLDVLSVGSSTPLLVTASIGAPSVSLGSRILSISAAFTARDGDELLGDSSGGSFTLTLPSGPGDGEKVVLRDATGNFNVNNVTVNGNGKNINGSASQPANVDNGRFEFIYSQAAGEWRSFM